MKNLPIDQSTLFFAYVIVKVKLYSSEEYFAMQMQSKSRWYFLQHINAFLI